MRNRREQANLARMMSWQNASFTYPSIFPAQMHPVWSYLLCIPLTKLVLAYPPADPSVEQWFSKQNNRSQRLTRDRCHAFLHALLSTTLSHLMEICDDKVVAQKLQTEPRLATLASEFRDGGG